IVYVKGSLTGPFFRL
ncbi:aspartate ammonia-lyase, partial [Vibrio harveyi]